jgi:hypothetical protein
MPSLARGAAIFGGSLLPLARLVLAGGGYRSGRGIGQMSHGRQQRRNAPPPGMLDRARCRDLITTAPPFRHDPPLGMGSTLLAMSVVGTAEVSNRS